MKAAGGPLGLGALILDISTAEGDAIEVVNVALLERTYGALACWAGPAELVEVEDA